MAPFLRIEEQWFEPCPPSRGVDIVRVMNAYRPLDGFAVETGHTRIVDLTRDEESLLAGFHKNTRYEVRRASADGLTFRLHLDDLDGVVDDFRAAYAGLQTAKQLEPLRMKRLRRLREDEALCVTTMSDRDGTPVCWHVYVRRPDRVRLLHSVSLFRNEGGERQALVGRANRLLHWEDMRAWKAAGAEFYDFGGETLDDRDAAKAKIAAFKRGFGGEVVPVYSGMKALTLKGRAAMMAVQARDLLRRTA